MLSVQERTGTGCPESLPLASAAIEQAAADMTS